MEIIKELFVEWKLDVWANVLEVVGFIISIITLIIGFSVKGQVDKLRLNYLFDKRAPLHIKNLESSSSEISRLLNDYNNNRNLIKLEFSKCISELEDLLAKLPSNQSRKCKQVLSFLIQRNDKPFAKASIQKHAIVEFILKYPIRIYQTSESDVWTAYCGLKEIIVQVENIRSNRKTSL